MNLNKSVSTLSWKFRNQRSFKVYRDDIEAFNTILSALNDGIEKRIQNNNLLAKYIIVLYNEFLQYYKADVFSSIPIRELARIAEKPLSSHLETLKDSINLREQIFVSDEYEGRSVKEMSDEEVNTALEEIFVSGNSFSLADVETNMKRIIGEIIRKYGQND